MPHPGRLCTRGNTFPQIPPQTAIQPALGGAESTTPILYFSNSRDPEMTSWGALDTRGLL